MKRSNSKDVRDQLRIDVLETFADAALYESEETGKIVPPIASLVQQVDYMKNPGESLYSTCYRYFEGGSGLVYYNECREYLKELLGETDEEAQSFSDEQVWKKYLNLSASTMARLYTEHKAWVYAMTDNK